MKKITKKKKKKFNDSLEQLKNRDRNDFLHFFRRFNKHLDRYPGVVDIENIKNKIANKDVIKSFRQKHGAYKCLMTIDNTECYVVYIKKNKEIVLKTVFKKKEQSK